MSFTQTAIVSVNPPVVTQGSLRISWVGTLPSGSAWQIYVGGVLAWHGLSNSAHIPIPTDTVQISIGAVDLADAGTSFSSSLPPQPKLRVELSWEGGRFQDPVDADVQGFHVYGQDSPGGPIDYTVLLADIPVSIGGVLTDGFGLGGYGSGGFGFTAGTYTWTSDTLTSGTWTWSVRTYDAAGNEGPDAFWTQVINAPPLEPAPFPGTSIRLEYSLLAYGQFGFGVGGYGEPEVVLTWNPSPTG